MNPILNPNASTKYRLKTVHAGRLALAAALLGIGPALHAADSIAARGTPDFVLERQTLAAGGGRMDGGNFRVVGTIGQVDADELHPASGGAFSVVGGFWAVPIEKTPLEDAIFRDAFED